MASTPMWATPTLRSMPRLEELAIFIKTALCQDWHPTATVIDGFNDDRISLASPETLAIRVNFSDGLFGRATESDSNLGPIAALPTHRTKVLSSYELKHCIGWPYYGIEPCFCLPVFPTELSRVSIPVFLNLHDPDGFREQISKENSAS